MLFYREYVKNFSSAFYLLSGQNILECKMCNKKSCKSRMNVDAVNGILRKIYDEFNGQRISKLLGITPQLMVAHRSVFVVRVLHRRRKSKDNGSKMVARSVFRPKIGGMANGGTQRKRVHNKWQPGFLQALQFVFRWTV